MTSAAAKQAKSMNLVYLGWGKYGPKKGEPATHYSNNGKLTPIDKASPPAGKAPESTKEIPANSTTNPHILKRLTQLQQMSSAKFARDAHALKNARQDYHPQDYSELITTKNHPDEVVEYKTFNFRHTPEHSKIYELRNWLNLQMEYSKELQLFNIENARVNSERLLAQQNISQDSPHILNSYVAEWKKSRFNVVKSMETVLDGVSARIVNEIPLSIFRGMRIPTENISKFLSRIKIGKPLEVTRPAGFSYDNLVASRFAEIHYGEVAYSDRSEISVMLYAHNTETGLPIFNLGDKFSEEHHSDEMEVIHSSKVPMYVKSIKKMVYSALEDFETTMKIIYLIELEEGNG